MDALSIAILAAVIVAAIVCVIKLRCDKKRGKGCSGDCGRCRGCGK